jgi:hypothetical protein
VKTRDTYIVKALYGNTHLFGYSDGLLQDRHVRGAGAYRDDAPAGRRGCARSGDECSTCAFDGDAGKCLTKCLFLLRARIAHNDPLSALQHGGADHGYPFGRLARGVDDLGYPFTLRAAEVQRREPLQIADLSAS